MQRLQRERRVADPRVAVVPVALAARRLGQRRGEGRHRRPGRHVGEALDGQRGAHGAARASDDRARVRGPATTARSASSRPAARSPPRRPPATPGSRPRTASRTPARPPAASARARARSPSIPSDMSVRRRTVTPAPLASAACRSSSDERPLRRRRGRSRTPARTRASTSTVPAMHSSMRTSSVVGVVVDRGSRVRRHRVLARARGPSTSASRTTSQPPGTCHVVTSVFVPGSYSRAAGTLIPNGPTPEVARLAVEQRAEDARRVEARDAQPGDARRRARRARRCGSSTGTRSRRSAGTATAPRRSARRGPASGAEVMPACSSRPRPRSSSRWGDPQARTGRCSAVASPAARGGRRQRRQVRA